MHPPSSPPHSPSLSPSLSSSPLLILPESLVSSTPHQPPRILSLSFSGLLNPPLRLLEDWTEVGSQLWPAGKALARYLLKNKMDQLAGKEMSVLILFVTRFLFSFALPTRRIELGAGSGLVGLSLALHSPSLNIHLTDLPHILPTLKSNLALNAPLSPVHPSALSWGESPSPLLPNPPDVLLAADCVYFEPSFPLLMETMRELIGKETVCYFCFVKRRRADLGFLKRLRRVFDVRDVGEGWEGGEEGKGDGDFGENGDEDAREDRDTGNIESDCDEAVEEVRSKRRKQRIFMLEIHQKTSLKTYMTNGAKAS